MGEMRTAVGAVLVLVLVIMFAYALLSHAQ